MKAIPAFAAFDRGLRSGHEEAERRQLEVLGIETKPVKRKGPGRPKSPVKTEAKPRVMVGIQPDLGQQLEHLAAALDTQPLALARMILGAGVEALVRELEDIGKISIPLRLDVVREGKGRYFQHVRTVTPERFESLRRLNSQRLCKWKAWNHHDDTTGIPMPPPVSPALKR